MAITNELTEEEQDELFEKALTLKTDLYTDRIVLFKGVGTETIYNALKQLIINKKNDEYVDMMKGKKINDVIINEATGEVKRIKRD